MSLTVDSSILSASFPEASSGDWFVLHTRPRQEKALSEDLAAINLSHFLPLTPSVRYYGRRKVKAELPLFPGYVFLRGRIDDTYLADRTKRVAKIIPVNDQPRLDEELRSLFLALSAEQSLDPFPYLKAGVRVEVRSGPLRGVRGVVESRTRLDRLVLQISIFGRAVSLEVDGALLDVID